MQSEAQKYSPEVQALLIFKLVDHLRPFFHLVGISMPTTARIAPLQG
jgi:hypothetical protein